MPGAKTRGAADDVLRMREMDAPRFVPGYLPEPPAGDVVSADELAALLAHEIKHWGEVVRAARIAPE